MKLKYPPNHACNEHIRNGESCLGPEGRDCSCIREGRMMPIYEPTGLASVRLTELYNAILQLPQEDQVVLLDSLDGGGTDRMCRTCQGQGYLSQTYDARTGSIIQDTCQECEGRGLISV